LRKEVRAFIDNRSVIISVFITSLRASHEYIGLLVVFDDITDIIEAQKARTWQEMARRIAHEIKNPLTPIRLSTERLIKKWEHKEADFDNIFERSTKTIVKEVESLRRLVDEFSRYGKMPEIKKTPTDIPTLIEEVVHLYKNYKGIEINTSIPGNIPKVDIDAEQFKRVIINIFENAIQAMPDGGMIHIALDHDEGDAKAYIHISDNGPGISDADKDKLFLPYFSTKTNGAGLGLAIAHRIISEHGGHIRIKNNKPRGTIFTIEILVKEC
jgi:two-component system nitrogen regulation sensor histidine kinase NtrY